MLLHVEGEMTFQGELFLAVLAVVGCVNTVLSEVSSAVDA